MRFYYFIYLFLLILYSCQGDEQLTEVPGYSVKVYECKEEKFRRTYESFGHIAAIEKADVYPMLSEIIDELYFEEGDFVTKGALLARLNCSQMELQENELKAKIMGKEAFYRLSIEKLKEKQRAIEGKVYSIKSAELELKEKKAELKRMEEILSNKKSLYEAGGITKEDLNNAEMAYMEKETRYEIAANSVAVQKIGYREQDLIDAGFVLPDSGEAILDLFIEINTKVESEEVTLAYSDLQSALAGLESFYYAKDLRQIYAPISGIIAGKFLNPGERVSPDKVLYRIYENQKVYAIVNVSEKDMLSLEKGQECLVYNDARMLSRRGVITHLSPQIHSETRNGQIKILLDNQDFQFKIGQYVSVSVFLDDQKNALFLPPSSTILDENDNHYVFLFRNNHVFRKSIKAGQEINGRQIVLEGLSEGDLIVQNPQTEFKDGQEVSLR